MKIVQKRVDRNCIFRQGIWGLPPQLRHVPARGSFLLGEALLSPWDHILGGSELMGKLLIGARTWEPRCQTPEPVSDLSLSGRVISARLRLLKTRNPAWISLLWQATATARTPRPVLVSRVEKGLRRPHEDRPVTSWRPLGTHWGRCLLFGLFSNSGFFGQLS